MPDQHGEWTDRENRRQWDAERREADRQMVAMLRVMVKDDSTLRLVRRHRSRSGDTEIVDLLVAPAQDEIVSIGAAVAHVLGGRVEYDAERNGMILKRCSVERLIAMLCEALDLPGLKWRWI